MGLLSLTGGCSSTGNGPADVGRKITSSEATGGVAERLMQEVVQSTPSQCPMSLFDGSSLDGWKATDFLDAGNVRMENGCMILEKGWELTGVTWTGVVPRNNYEITLDAMRVEGEDFFCGLTFPVGVNYCTLIVGGWRGKVVGLSTIDLMDAAENQTAVLLDFEKGRWYRIRLHVTPDRIRAWIDDSRIIDADTGGRIISVRHEVERSCPLGIASWKTTAAIRNICLRAI